MKRVIKAVLTDLDGVIRHFPVGRDEKIEHEYGLPLRSISNAAFDTLLLESAITGKISDETWRANQTVPKPRNIRFQERHS